MDNKNLNSESENELDMDAELAAELKRVMDATLDLEGICVNDDLINKTLAAIPGAKGTRAAEWNIEDRTELLRRRRNWGSMIAIAAALVLAIVGFFSNISNTSTNDMADTVACTEVAEADAACEYTEEESMVLNSAVAMDYGSNDSDISFTSRDDSVPAAAYQDINKGSSNENTIMSVTVANPIVETDAQTIRDTMGFEFNVPEDAVEVNYLTVMGTIAELNFRDSRAIWTFRAKEAEESDDISGMYYDWIKASDCQDEYGCENIMLGMNGDNYVGVYLKYDAVKKIQYCITADAFEGQTLEANDLVDMFRVFVSGN